MEDGEVVFSGVCGGEVKFLMDSCKDAKRARLDGTQIRKVSFCV